MCCVSYSIVMFYAAKVGFIITVLTALVVYGLRITANRPAGKVSQIATFATAGSFAILCISQIWVALFGIAVITACYANRRIYAAGISIFMIVTMPGTGVTLMVGDVKLIILSLTTAVTIGMLIASVSWEGQFRSKKYTNIYPLFAIFIVLTFISARGSSVTVMLRAFTENFVSYIIPYILIRSSLRDFRSISITAMFVIAAGLAVSAIAIFESFMVWPIYQTYGQSFGTLINAGVKMRGGMLRAAGPSMNPPLSSAGLALCFVTAFASASLFKTKIGHWMVLTVIALGLFVMQARVGWLGAVVGSVAVLVSKRGIRTFATYIPIIMLLSGGIYGLAQVNEKFANLTGFSADAKGSSEYREQMSDRGIQIVKDHILIGQPVSSVENQMENFRQGEGIVDFVNGYLAIALFSGLLGLALFVSALLVQAFNGYAGKKVALARGAGSLADLGFGLAIGATIMFPFIPTDYRVILVMLLLFALSNAVITHSHINPFNKSNLKRDRKNLIAESGINRKNDAEISI